MEMPAAPSNANLHHDVSTNGFTFRKRNERVDWKKLASIDIGKLSQSLDFHCLQDNIVHVTFCDIEHEVDRNSVDPNYIKLYKLAQLIIEYLLHSQEYLANVIQNLEEKLKQTLGSLEEEKIARSKDQKYINDLKKENKKRKRQLAAQQQYFESLNKQYSQCSHCPKTFIGPSFLQSHILRRHPEFADKIPHENIESKENTNVLIALGKQLEDIKEKFTKSSLGNFTGENVINGNKIIEEKYANEKEMLLKSIEEWKKDEMTRHTAELEAVRNTFMKELKEVEKKHQNSEIALKELQDKYAQVSQLYLEKSHFQHSSSLEREQEVQALKEQFESQLNFVESDLQKYLKKQEKEWQKKMEKQLYERNLEIEKLNSALQESIEQIRKEQEKKASNEKYYVKQIQKLTDISKEQEKKLKEISDMQNQLQQPNKTPPPPPPRTYIVNKSSQSQSHTRERMKFVEKKAKSERDALIEKYEKFSNIRDCYENVINHLANDSLKALEEKSQQVKCFPDKENYTEKSAVLKQSPILKSQHFVSSLLSPKAHNSRIDSFDTSPKFTHPYIKTSSPKTSYSFAPAYDSSPKLDHSILKKSHIENPNKSQSPLVQHMPVKGQMQKEDSSNSESIEEEYSSILKTLKEVQPAPRKSLTEPKRVSFEDEKTSSEDSELSDSYVESSESSEAEDDDDDDDDTGINQYQPIRVKPPSGERVTKLTQSIENQLMGRNSKPPPGAIDVTPKGIFASQIASDQEKFDDDISLSSPEKEFKTFETQIQTYKTDITSKVLNSNAWSTSKKDESEIQGSTSTKKGTSSWDSEDDLSIEEIQ
ncbi:zinc finger protein DZIP1L-like [Centruroides sculpturatus]|uniref:zinc finger protein DZIP1L-like n=2 Tax=Centruroides sculpturatus TaxID=218467 RepID=UPI000C6E43E6|nr:zinc finger protein DZIP1L-like [Centruroides sculpturatus]